MELPIELKNIIENELDKADFKNLKMNAENISLKYRNEVGKKGKRLVIEDIEAISYAAVRMPATYSAVYTALNKSIELYGTEFASLLDVGAGTGAGSWAANSLLNLSEITCLEREDAMLQLGKNFMNQSEANNLRNAKWEKFDLVNSKINYKADLVICSYVLNELDDNNVELALEKLWGATNKVLLIIEPGTPNGFLEIRKLREMLKKFGARVVAPCPNLEKCPLTDDDWCHAICRVSRTKIHKILKSADVPYEDEKFSYIAVCKNSCEEGKDYSNYARVLRHPKIESGKITIKVCSENGILERAITKKDKELFKIARKLKCGDLFKMC